jgi:hypothetical protein
LTPTGYVPHPVSGEGNAFLMRPHPIPDIPPNPAKTPHLPMDIRQQLRPWGSLGVPDGPWGPWGHWGHWGSFGIPGGSLEVPGGPWGPWRSQRRSLGIPGGHWEVPRRPWDVPAGPWEVPGGPWGPWRSLGVPGSSRNVHFEGRSGLKGF